MKQVNIHEAKTHLSRLLAEAAAGEDVVIAKAGTPVARLVPIEHKKERRKLGALKGKIWISPDFDAPLPDDIAEAFGAKE